MKKAFLVLILFALLAACKPATTPEPMTPTPAPTDTPTMVPTLVTTEKLATMDALVIGVWYAEEGLFMEIKDTNAPDLRTSFYDASQDVKPWKHLGYGTAKFDSGKLTFLTSEGYCAGQEATYEIYAVFYSKSIFGMKPKLVGEDACTERKNALDGKFLMYANGSATDGTEQTPKSGADMVGYWFGSYGYFDMTGDVDQTTGNADLTFYAYNSYEADPWYMFGTAKVSYENGKVTIEDNTCPGGDPATYEPVMIVKDNRIFGMKLKLVGEDKCKDRQEYWSGVVLYRVSP